MTELLQTIVDFVRDLDPGMRALLAGFGMLLETSVFVGLIVPGDTVALVAAVGVTTPPQFAVLVIALVSGALAGETIGFFLGRYFGPKLRASRAGQRLGEQNWRIADHYLGERGGAAVFLSRFLPVLHSLIPLTAGMAGMRYRRFISWTAPASLIWALIVVSLGTGAAVGLDHLASRVKGAGFIVLGIAAVTLCGLWAIKRLFLRRESRHLGRLPDSASPESDERTP